MSFSSFSSFIIIFIFKILGHVENGRIYLLKISSTGAEILFQNNDHNKDLFVCTD